MASDLLRSPQGDLSSKRVAGYFLGVWGVVCMTWGALAHNADLMSAGRTFLITGAGLLGVGVVEHMR